MNDIDAFNASLHLFNRNAVGCMDLSGSYPTKLRNLTYRGGSIRNRNTAFLLAALL